MTVELASRRNRKLRSKSSVALLSLIEGAPGHGLSDHLHALIPRANACGGAGPELQLSNRRPARRGVDLPAARPLGARRADVEPLLHLAQSAGRSRARSAREQPAAMAGAALRLRPRLPMHQRSVRSPDRVLAELLNSAT